MTLEGANNFSENNDSVIYTMNSPQTGQYCAVVPKSVDNGISMLVDINMKSSFDALMANSITKEVLVNKINEEYKIINETYKGCILVLPMLDVNLLSNAVNSGDKQKMFDETKKIGGITSEIYKKLTESGVDKSKIDQKIVIILNNDNDIKFVEWLKSQMPNFVDGVSLNELKSKISVSSVNPFASVNPFTGEANVESVGSPASNDIFGNNVSLNVQDKKVEEPVALSSFDVFGAQPQQEMVGSVEGQNPVPAVNVVEPQPVQGVSLNNDPFVNNQPLSNDTLLSNNNSVPSSQLQSDDMQTSEVNEIDKKSGGFANLLILLIILVGVTIVSIELGKYLYNTFGI